MTASHIQKLSFRRVMPALAPLVALAIGCADSTSTQPTPPVVNAAKPTPPAPPPGPPQGGPPAPVPEYIYVANPDGSDAHRIALGGWASWSPDSRRILFHRGPTFVWPMLPSSIYVIDADGTNETLLATGYYPSWSPDGRKIAFSDSAGLEVMNADGTGKTLLLRHDFNDDAYPPWDMGPAKPVWSPDGKRIAFEHLGDGDIQPAQVFVMNVDGLNLHRVSVNTGTYRFAESDPAWSPDGLQLAYWSYGYGIVVTNADGGPPRAIFKDFPAVAYGAKPAWTRDGGSLAFNSGRFVANNTQSILIVSLQTGAMQLFLRDAFDLAYSPDGKHIAFTTTRSE